MLQISPEDMRSRAIAAPAVRRRKPLARLIATVTLLLLVTVGATVWIVTQQHDADRSSVRLDISRPPPPLPHKLQEGFMQLDPKKAEEINKGIAVSTAPIELARPFLLPANVADIISRQSAVECLTAAVYYEAASETLQGQRAVAQVVLNRVRHPAYPKSVCGVVYEGAERRTGCQFTFTCDGSLARKPSTFGWNRARLIAQAALAGVVEPSVGTATHYHTTWVVPYWAWSLDKIGIVGAHIFYRWKGYWGRRAAFKGLYAGEPNTPVPGLVLPYDTTGLAEVGSQPGVTIPGPKLLADDAGMLVQQPHGPAAEPSFQPRADQEAGALVADEKAGTLMAGGDAAAR